MIESHRSRPTGTELLTASLQRQQQVDEENRKLDIASSPYLEELFHMAGIDKVSRINSGKLTISLPEENKEKFENLASLASGKSTDTSNNEGLEYNFAPEAGKPKADVVAVLNELGKLATTNFRKSIDDHIAATKGECDQIIREAEAIQRRVPEKRRAVLETGKESLEKRRNKFCRTLEVLKLPLLAQEVGQIGQNAINQLQNSQAKG